MRVRARARTQQAHEVDPEKGPDEGVARADGEGGDGGGEREAGAQNALDAALLDDPRDNLRARRGVD